MDLAELSIKRPIFITCIVFLSIVAGLMALSRLGVDLFPDVTFPVVVVSTPYPGAGPEEIETLVSKPLEDQVSTISGLKRLTSTSQEGMSTVVAEFNLETDFKYAEQQIRDKVSASKRLLPKDIKEPIIRRIDPADQPIYILSVDADLPPAELYDFAKEKVKPKLEQVNQVGLVEIVGGRKREIQVALDPQKLKDRNLSVQGVIARMAGSGENIPVGKQSTGEKEAVFRTVGQFNKISDIENLVVNFVGNDIPVAIRDIGSVNDTLEDEKSRAFVNGKKTIMLFVFKQSGSNTIAVSDGLKKKIQEINETFKKSNAKAEIKVVRDGSLWIRANVLDVEESIAMGTFLAIVVVFFFLGSLRSTIITGLALPNSLIGAFILMAMAGFSINIMSLLALSLSVGLLVDDAIVVRENIFRHIELGKPADLASIIGTKEVRLAVIATTFTVIAVFGPLGFLKGVTGQFFKQFGLTVCFAMAISLFDALTIAPMLSAYFATTRDEHKKGFYANTIGRLVNGFEKFQDKLVLIYEKVLKFTLAHPLAVLFMSFVVFIVCSMLVVFVPKTFLPTQDQGEFTVALDLPPGTSLDKMSEVAAQADQIIRKHKEIDVSQVTVGSREGEPNFTDIYVHLVPMKMRSLRTNEVKDKLRDDLKVLAFANPKVKDYDPVGGGMRPFAVNITGTDQKELEKYGLILLDKLKKYPGLKDTDINFRPGKPEFQVQPDRRKAQMLGVTTTGIGNELRAQVEGFEAAKFREDGLEYDVRVRLADDKRNLKERFNETYVPNMNNFLINLATIARPIETEGPSKINRQDRNRYVQVSADITPGAGLGNIMNDVTNMLQNEIKLPKELGFVFIGQAENFKELGESMRFAMGAGIIFIFLVLSSLYESFITPFTIMLALPLAICGSFLALFIAQESLNIFSMIGIIMLLGVATKNSILLVDYAHQETEKGIDRINAMLAAGKTRLRPILMTTMALIAGTVPIALGLNEASRQRTSMGVAIIGGLISSTLLTLVVVPAAYIYIDRYRVWVNSFLKRKVVN
ncbi:MAG: hypothetical protein A4S09_03230 [Proteobacteria bacterium SG_bin7]|nr:MAG: hypothetical protein A4S09_03230 [Proteobacteria bacterium SG_bin7]